MLSVASRSRRDRYHQANLISRHTIHYINHCRSTACITTAEPPPVQRERTVTREASTAAPRCSDALLTDGTDHGWMNAVDAHFLIRRNVATDPDRIAADRICEQLRTRTRRSPRTSVSVSLPLRTHRISHPRARRDAPRRRPGVPEPQVTSRSRTSTASRDVRAERPKTELCAIHPWLKGTEVQLGAGLDLRPHDPNPRRRDRPSRSLRTRGARRGSIPTNDRFIGTCPVGQRPERSSLSQRSTSTRSNSGSGEPRRRPHCRDADGPCRRVRLHRGQGRRCLARRGPHQGGARPAPPACSRTRPPPATSSRVLPGEATGGGSRAIASGEWGDSARFRRSAS